ncbi:hypothetical protein EDC02_7295 [Micromonospora sp. Llam0]|nr:hypothetical protein EDC02_7295 [Micromonospora sp. Llam0]
MLLDPRTSRYRRSGGWLRAAGFAAWLPGPGKARAGVGKCRVRVRTTLLRYGRSLLRRYGRSLLLYVRGLLRRNVRSLQRIGRHRGAAEGGRQ